MRESMRIRVANGETGKLRGGVHDDGPGGALPAGGGGRTATARLVHRIPAWHSQGQDLQGPGQEPYVHQARADEAGDRAAADRGHSRELKSAVNGSGY